MNKQLIDEVSKIDKLSLEDASKNNFRMMYAGDADYKVKQNDVLYIKATSR